MAIGSRNTHDGNIPGPQMGYGEAIGIWDSSQEQPMPIRAVVYVSEASPTVVGDNGRKEATGWTSWSTTPHVSTGTPALLVLLFDGGGFSSTWRDRRTVAGGVRAVGATSHAGWWAAAGRVATGACRSGRCAGFRRSSSWKSLAHADWVGFYSVAIRRPAGIGNGSGGLVSCTPCRMTRGLPTYATGEQSSRAVPVNPHCPRSLHRADRWRAGSLDWSGRTMQGRCHAALRVKTLHSRDTVLSLPPTSVMATLQAPSRAGGARWLPVMSAATTTTRASPYSKAGVAARSIRSNARSMRSPRCAHCDAPSSDTVEGNGQIFCCAHCAGHAGVRVRRQTGLEPNTAPSRWSCRHQRSNSCHPAAPDRRAAPLPAASVTHPRHGLRQDDVELPGVGVQRGCQHTRIGCHPAEPKSAHAQLASRDRQRVARNAECLGLSTK